MSLGLNILLIFIFLLLGSVFAGTELALVSLRGSQIDQMELQDARGARVAKIARDPNTFLSSVQIGVTLSGFLSASFGESSIAPFVVPVVEGWGVPHHIAAPLTTIGLTLIISYCSIVISELVPKRIAMQRNEAIARAVVPAIDVFSKVCRPLIWLIGKNTNGLVRLLGFDPNETETEVSDDELRVLVNSNTNLSKDERTILDDVFDASETIVAEVMRPRADVVFIDGAMSLDEAAAFVRDQPYSRYPVTGKDFDDVIGFVHVRDLLDVRDPNAKTVSDVTREGISLPGTSKLLPSLELLRKRGIHLAVVIDEYGGLEGLVTFTDIMRAILGELPDNRGHSESPVIARDDGSWLVDGMYAVDEFKDTFNLRELPDEDEAGYQTVGGMIMTMLGRVPAPGSKVQVADYQLEVMDMDGRRVDKVLVSKEKPAEDEGVKG